MTLVPWEEGVACCIADLHPVGEHPPPADPRAPSPCRRRLRGARFRAGRRARARVLPVRAGPRLAGRHQALRGQPEHGLYGRSPGRPSRHRARDRGGPLEAWYGDVRGQPRVHELAVRDQPPARAGPDGLGPRLPPEVRREGRGRDARPRRHVYGQAVQRPGRLGLSLPLLARPRRQQRLRRRR